MFFLVLRKIMNNKWLMVCLLVGSILAVAMVSSIPLYTDGILQRMLTKDLEAFQQDTGYYPGRYTMDLNAYTYYDTGEKRISAYQWFDGEIKKKMVPALSLPVQQSVKRLGMDHMSVVPEVQREEEPVRRYLGLYAVTNFFDHIKIVGGRLPASEPVDGVYEVIIPQSTQGSYDLLLDEVLTASDRTKQFGDLRLKVVGIYTRVDNGDAWWNQPEEDFEGAMIMDYNLFVRDIMAANNTIVSARWYYALDYSKLSIEQLKSFNDTIVEQKETMAKYSAIEWDFPAMYILQEYFDRAKQLKTTLWVLQVPILLMLAFYIFMVTQLIVENDKNEIAVLKSRGAAGRQVFLTYLIQSLLLSGASMVLGPVLAFGICGLLGSSNGFLEFVSRTALPLKMNATTLLYALYAGVFSVLMMMVPAMAASHTTIVEHKQKKARRWNVPVWQKFFLDFILLGISFYGLYQYKNLQETVLVTQAEGMEVPVDPFLFLISTLFVLGAGLLFLRLYPYIIRFVSWLGRKYWTPVLYTSITQVGRSSGREQFLMLFLILTISIGVFSANSARTINQNIEDRINYANGADLTLQMQWPSNKPTTSSTAGPPSEESATVSQQTQAVIYQEPAFSKYSKLDGTVAAARVFMPDKVSIGTGVGNYKTGLLMAINPVEFGNVVWYGDGLLPYHINNYLNNMSENPSAIYVSAKLMEELGLEPGDSIYYTWGDQQQVEGVVYGSVPYWPGLNPNREVSEYFIVANLDYVQGNTSLEPYQIWYKKADGATTKQIYDDIEAKKMMLAWVKDTKQEITQKKNDPLLQGTNGAMTMGFVVTMAISMIGFFIYWILSIQARTLQFGIFRAMGMSASRVILMLVVEQVLISGVAILMGLFIGGVMCQLFVPLLGMVYSAADQVPPFRVVTNRSDYVRLYTVIGAMLVAGLALLGGLVSRIKVAQAIKLGED